MTFISFVVSVWADFMTLPLMGVFTACVMAAGGFALVYYLIGG